MMRGSWMEWDRAGAYKQGNAEGDCHVYRFLRTG